MLCLPFSTKPFTNILHLITLSSFSYFLIYYENESPCVNNSLKNILSLANFYKNHSLFIPKFVINFSFTYFIVSDLTSYKMYPSFLKSTSYENLIINRHFVSSKGYHKIFIFFKSINPSFFKIGIVAHYF